ncbi:transposable element Tcb2 transposase [Trichonephila clavipes]|nr:transposable element Tcb2 transposase [Trichonephila clavipes]
MSTMSQLSHLTDSEACRVVGRLEGGQTQAEVAQAIGVSQLGNRACELEENEWNNVLFSDESHFSVHPDNRRIFIWRDRGSRNNPTFVHESVRFGGGGVLVYGGISIDGRTDLCIIRDGPLTARRYSVTFERITIVRVHYFVRGGFVGYRSRASSKHLSPHLPVDELDSSGVKKGLRCRCKMHVWVLSPQRSRLDVDVWRSDVTALALSFRTFPLRKV